MAKPILRQREVPVNARSGEMAEMGSGVGMPRSEFQLSLCRTSCLRYVCKKAITIQMDMLSVLLAPIYLFFLGFWPSS